MKKLLVTVSVTLFFCYWLSGQAFVIPPTGNNARALNCQCYQLTADSQSQAGAIWNQNSINLNNSFDFKFNVFLGSRNGSYAADGITFVIQNQNTSLAPSGGGGMGYAFLAGRSIGVEFDTYNNTGPCELAQEHIALDTNGNLCPPLAGPFPAIPSGANMDDGQWHIAEFIWNASTQTINVYFDGNLRLTYTFAGGLVNTIFNGQNNVYWGWTGGTGGYTNVQQVCAYFHSDFAVGVNYIHCGPDTVSFQNTSVSNLNNIIGYNWNFGDNSTSTLSNPVHTFAAPGAYNVTLIVTDQTLCQDTQFHQVRIDLPTSTTSQTNVSCNHGNNGSATINVSNGILPYSYSWTPSVSSTNAATSLTAGTYIVTATDSARCSVTQTFNITEPSALITSENHTDVLCNGGATGTITIIANGGTPGYTYQWNPPVSSTSTANGVRAGNYSVTVSDLHSCTAVQTATVNEPPSLVVSATPTDALCNGQASGSILASATGGVPGYSYTAFDGSNTSSSASGQFNNLGANTYTIIVTDQNACMDTTTTTINQPTPLVTSETHVDVLCHGGSDGEVTIIASGATPGYSFAWSPNVSTIDSANHLTAGTYTVTVSDANNCTAIQAATVNEPPSMVITYSSTDVLCFGQSTGSLTVSASGGVPAYNYSAFDGTTSLFSSSGQFNNLAANNYTVVVTDQHTCTDTALLTVNQPPVLTDIIVPTAPLCYHYSDGKMEVTASGGVGGFGYAFSTGLNNSTGELTGLPQGSYAVTITDANGCTITDSTTLVEPDSVLITVSPTPVEVKLGQSLQLSTSSNQTLTVNYTWTPEFGLSCYDCAEPIFSGNYSQEYLVVGNNSNGCRGTTNFVVTVIPDYGIFFPNAFTPNGDGINDYWQIFGNLTAIKQIEFTVFDRIGEKVFESNDVNFQWDGDYKGKPAPPGTYVYTGKVVWLNNHSDAAIKGTIALIR